MSATTLPTLLSRIHALVSPASGLPKSASYILPASTLTALGRPTLLGPLFSHVVETGEDGRTASLHLRDMLLKEWTLVGIPLVITAVASLAAAEARLGLLAPPPQSTFADDASWKERLLSTRYRSGVDVSPRSPHSTRGAAHLRKLYRAQLPGIMGTWGQHEADFRWLEESVIYGLFLSDHSVLSEVETSLVTTSGIMAQGRHMKAPALWHLRGLRRLGVSTEDTRKIVEAVGECCLWAGGRVPGSIGTRSEVEECVGWVDEVDCELDADADAATRAGGGPRS